jgi:hypothetical protein
MSKYDLDEKHEINVSDSFVKYFSNLDIDGLSQLLDEDLKYDGISKVEYLELIRKVFLGLKNENLSTLKAVKGKCSGCKVGCEGFLFINELNKIYYNIVIEIKNSKIHNFIECYNFDVSYNLKDFEQIEIKPFKLKDWNSELPF